MTDDNVTNIRPAKVTKLPVGDHPSGRDVEKETGQDVEDWLKAANSIKDDFEADRDQPAALDRSMDHDTTEHLRELSMRPPIKIEDIEAIGKLAEKLEFKADEDDTQFHEIDPQNKKVIVFALVLACLIFATSALFSFPTIAATAALMLPVWPFLVWVVPGFVEVFIVFFGVEVIMWQARATNDRKYSAGQRAKAQKMSDSAIGWQLVFAMIAVVANAAHTYMGQEAAGALGTWQAWLGISLAALAPLSVVLITKRASRLIFIYSVKE